MEKGTNIGETLDLHAEHMILNFGPSHPATHGTLRIILELEGETIVKCDTEIGYLHRGIEKLAEDWTYNKCVNLTDRLNYCSAFMNNTGFHLACEKLFEIEVPPRAQYIRTILSEVSRIADHMTAIGPNFVDIGALTPFWYCWAIRENAYDLLEFVAGARMTTAFTRVGGLEDDVPAGFGDKVMAFIPDVYSTMDEVEKLLAKNRIFNDRTRGVGALSGHEAVSYGWTGPCLRACGIPHDLRKANPYMVYDQLDFDIPIGEHGDTYDRIFVRIEECRQSARIIEQALDKMPEGPVKADAKQVVLPEKDGVYNFMEDLIHHFEIVMYGPKAPKEDASYEATEAANGELGFYLVSDGSNKPYRMHVRPPCFHIMAALPRLVEGSLIADLSAVLASLNIIAGELDR
ncbi:MAG: NADH dehydrogenase (quinone) subunit D [Deltaproteobacteria bacterium]|nr:NADH dehydrogenase (quinone) subunit D [Deltaproteobacteria bacterium]